MMKAKFLYLLVLINFTLFKNAESQMYSYGKYIACGRKNPEELDDCLDHSLSSGFKCCYITELPDSKPNVCGLVAIANIKNIKAPIYQGPPYFDCGKIDEEELSGFFMKFSFTLLLLLFIF